MEQEITVDQRETGAPTKTEAAPANGTSRPVSSEPAHEAAPKPKRQRPAWLRFVIYAVAAVAIVLALIFGIKWLAYATTHETTDDAHVDADTIEVTSKINERVDKIFVDTNQRVTKGELLIQLDDRDERERYNQAVAARDAQMAQARAADANVALTRDQQAAQNSENAGGISSARAMIASAQAQYAAAQQQIAVAQSDLVSAQDAVPAAKQNLAKAQADLQRTQSLVNTGDVARSQLDAERAAYQQAQSQLQEALANVAAARQKVGQYAASAAAAQATITSQQGALATAQGKLNESDAPYRIPASEAQAQAQYAQVGSLEAQVKTALDQLNYTRIHAPADGYVGQKSVEVGQTVAPGQALLELVPLNRVYITANYKETQVGSMKPGQEVDINVDAYKGYKFRGHVEAINPASENTYSLVPAQNATGNFVKVTQRIPVRIAVDNQTPDHPLRPGMSVETSVRVK